MITVHLFVSVFCDRVAGGAVGGDPQRECGEFHGPAVLLPARQIPAILQRVCGRVRAHPFQTVSIYIAADHRRCNFPPQRQ